MEFPPYKTRPIRFIEVFACGHWQVKIYGISTKNRDIHIEFLHAAKANIETWLVNANNYKLPVYQIATLILHEGQEGNFAIINWWIGENMLQNHVYFSDYSEPTTFSNFSKNGIQLCVWELAVVWHERNAWLKHILRQHENPDWNAYLKDVIEEDI